MSKAKLLGMPRKGLPNNRCHDRHWKNNERNTKYGKDNKYLTNGARRYPRKG